MMSGLQRQPLQKQNIACSSPESLVRNGSTLKANSAGTTNSAAAWEALDMSAVGCGTSSQSCQLPIPGQGVSAHFAAWQKQLSACATNSRRAPEGLPLPGRQPSARSHAFVGELRSVSQDSKDLAMTVPGSFFSSLQAHQCTLDLQSHTVSSCSCSYCLLYLLSCSCLRS